ncbi:MULTISPECIES: cation:proton antiporter [unclassified Ekhidna]|jgi:Kef-type K+ transport system membrane component KefB/Trk K+ transport system NAD-binding subunit|uniref:cation:proton antiporter domain-containing protein n=1 Tax=unclassified Ekhidna TaxID=2632188 RepID=UPI0032DF3383
MDINYTPLFIVFIIAWLVPLLLSWFEISKVPSVILKIVMGVVIGPYVLDLMDETQYMDFLAQTGFLILIFLSGLEIDVNKIIASLPRKFKLHDMVSNTLIMATIIYFGSLILSLPVAWLISQFIAIDITFYAFLLPTVAVSITVPILKESGELNRRFGQVLLMEGAIATVMSIILISIYSGVLKNGFQVELLLFTLIFVAFVVIYVVGKRLLKVRTFQKLLYTLEHAASQIRVRGAVVLLLLFVMVAHMINTEYVMGAFFAGVLLSMFVNKERSALLFKLDGMSYGFFIPIFFIMVGVNLDLSALSNFQESIPLILILVFSYFFIQIIPSLIMSRIFGVKRAIAGGVLNTSRMGLTIAAAQIGLSLEVITTADNAGIVASAIIVSLISPSIYRMFSEDKEEHHGIYIFGGSRVSLHLAERLNMHDSSCITYLQNKEIAQEFDRKGIKHEDIEKLDTNFLDTINFRPTDLVIVLTESRVLNLELTRHLKNHLDHKKIITRKQSAAHDLIDPQGDLKIVDHDEVLANHIEDMVTRPHSVGTLQESFGMYRVEEIQITKKSIHRLLVKEIAFPPSGSLVIQRRKGEIFIPHGDTHLLLGDVITVIGNTSALHDFRRILGG